MGGYDVLLQEKTPFLDVSPSVTKNIQRGASNSKKQESYDNFTKPDFFGHFSGESGGIWIELLTWTLYQNSK